MPPPPHGGRLRRSGTLTATAALPCLHLPKGLCWKHLDPEGLFTAPRTVFASPSILTIQGLETPYPVSRGTAHLTSCFLASCPSLQDRRSPGALVCCAALVPADGLGPPARRIYGSLLACHHLWSSRSRFVSDVFCFFLCHPYGNSHFKRQQIRTS